MSDNLLNTIYLSGAFLLLFGSAELLFWKFKLQAEVTRKYVHIVTGLLTMLFPPLVGDPWLVLLLCGSFLLILMASMKFDLLPSINGVDRKTRGSILYPIVVFACYLMYTEYGQFIFYYLPILILAICDPIAALVGKRWPRGKYTTFGQTKTLSGSAGFFIGAFLLCAGLIFLLEGYLLLETIVTSFVIAFVTTVAEALTHKGYDNFTIPGSTLLALISMQIIMG
jgi:phytol kinase